MCSTLRCYTLFLALCLFVQSVIFHLEHQFAAFHNVGVVYVVLLIALAVEVDFVYIELFFAQSLGHHCECLAAGQLEGDFRHLGCAEDVAAAHGVYGIEAHSREHVPGRHLSAVVIAAESVGLGQILGVEYLAHQFLRAFGGCDL